MCGIVGIISKTAIELTTLQQMTATLHHRGPDSNGTFISPDGNVGFGHTRLSIIDLSDNGSQPMLSHDGRYAMVFNGEIYNFRKLKAELLSEKPAIDFISNSDSEVLLQAFIHWGPSVASKLEGMFAVAIYDAQIKKVFLLRDRKGKKPIFYYSDSLHFVFASEIKSLLQHPVIAASKEIDTQAIHEFLHLGYIPEPKTIYRSIRKFPSGAVGEVLLNLSFSVKQYWKIETVVDGRYASGNFDFKEILRDKLTKAVDKRLISDVPLGAFLSGGTDSSLITAMASKLSNKPLKTFSIGFKESKFDEHRFASQVAKHLGTDHTEFILSEKDSVQWLETYLDHFDEPFADTSAIPTMLVARMAKQQVTVALTGDGGDELFLGYGTHTWANRLTNSYFKVVKPFLASAFKISNTPRLKRIAELLVDVDPGTLRSHIFSQEQYFFSNHEIQLDLLVDPLSYVPFKFVDSPVFYELIEAEKQAIFDFKCYLKDDLLVKIDRASMFSALECRCPLLDNSIIEFAVNIPFDLKRKNGIPKWPLKELLADYLPENLINRPKWGFSIPLAQWMKNDLRYLMEYLSDENLNKTGLFKIAHVRSLIKRFNNGDEYLYNRLWVLIIIQRFLLKNE
jgi:asparagine synthase (glutamine-hydrolysing)